MKPGKILITVILCQVLAVSCNAQVPGCTDPLATNYDPSATLNDGSCVYNPSSVYPGTTSKLSDQIRETSGLILWEGNLWTHNDNDDVKLYGLDTVSADILRTLELTGVHNEDWEEISQDDMHIYVGDFGNNLSGSRTDLHILRVEKASLLAGSPVIDTIWFSYSDQINPVPTPDANQTDFDCEAFIVTEDSIYLFTKQWTTVQTTVYHLPKVPGTYVAMKKETYNIKGLITGATYIASKRIVVLCGYTSVWIHPFLYLLYDFEGSDFFSGNKRSVSVELPFHQVEAVAWSYGTKYYISNEDLSLAGTPQKLHILDLGEFLDDYLARTPVVDRAGEAAMGLHLFPNPAASALSVRSSPGILPVLFEVVNSKGESVLNGQLTSNLTQLDVGSLAPGRYTVILYHDPVSGSKVSGSKVLVEGHPFIKL